MLVETLTKEVKPIVRDEMEFDYRDMAIIRACFSFLSYRDSEGRENIDDFPKTLFTTGGKLLIRVLMEEVILNIFIFSVSRPSSQHALCKIVDGLFGNASTMKNFFWEIYGYNLASSYRKLLV